MSSSHLDSIIEGEVIQYNQNSAVIKCENNHVKVYHSYDLSYGDYVKMKVEQMDINEQKNDNGFNESLYLKANQIDYKAKCIELIEYEKNYHFVDFIEERLSQDEKIRSYQRLFLLGMKDEWIENDYQQLLDLSVIHLFALSGMHLQYLKKMIHLFFSFFFSKRTLKIITYLFLFFYITHIPYSISLYRAFFMIYLKIRLIS